MSNSDSHQNISAEDFPGVDPDVRRDELYFRLKTKALSNQLPSPWEVRARTTGALTFVAMHAGLPYAAR